MGWFSRFGILIFLLALNGAFAGALAVAVIYPKLPQLSILADYKPKLPLRVFTAEGDLIGEFGEEKRTVVSLAETPPLLVSALLSTEDSRFFHHRGIDFRALARAVRAFSQGRREGASTITMQVARNFFLTRDRTIFRKAFEVLLALEIERRFGKARILEFYLNQIYLGRGSFGFAAAAKTYYGKPLGELTLTEIAVLAGLPKAPSAYNPIANPSLAKSRQRHVLRRMLNQGAISEDEFLQASSADLPPTAGATRRRFAAPAEHVAEEVRKIIFDRFGEEAYERGFNIYTTIRTRLQKAAVAALRKGLLDHDRRHGYRGPEKFFNMEGATKATLSMWLSGESVVGGLPPAIVLFADRKRVEVFSADGEKYAVMGDALKFISENLPGAKNPLIRRGALVRLLKDDDGSHRIVQIPQAQSALVALQPEDGQVLAMAGGFDFGANKFNHATQAKRQPGSAVKPFVYSAGLEKGFTAASILHDSPVYLTAQETGSGEPWEPKNYDGKYAGPIRLRIALAKSKNLATVRLLQSIGAEYARDYLVRFGFRREDHPPTLSFGLGAGLTSPAEMAAGYAVFANGGYLIRPYLISRVEDYDGNAVSRALDFENRRRAIDSRNAFIMTKMLQSVIVEGTGTRAKTLGRSDLAGKTGTTNDTRDAWFIGFNPELAAAVWTGFDSPRSLGKKETGARAALPIWIDFMRAALEGVAEFEYLPPPGVVAAEVDAISGGLILSGASAIRNDASAGGIREYFYEEYLPPLAETVIPSSSRDELF